MPTVGFGTLQEKLMWVESNGAEYYELFGALPDNKEMIEHQEELVSTGIRREGKFNEWVQDIIYLLSVWGVGSKPKLKVEVVSGKFYYSKWE
jgi:hypothetical protein